MPNDDLGEMFDAAMAEADGGETVEVEPDTPVDEPVAESTDVEDDGVDVEVDNGEPEADPEPTGDEAWDWSEYADQLVPRTVNGETEMVPLKEAIEGSMRHADYTRKTQEIAEVQKAAKWASDIQAALQRDPVGTLEAIADAYGLIDRGAQQPQQNQQSEKFALDDLDEDIRPWAEQAIRANEQLAEMQKRFDQMERQREEQQIKDEVNQEIADLKNRFADFDAMATLQVAAQRNMRLEDAYWYLKGQNIQQQTAQQQTAEQAAAQAAAEAAQAAEAKRAQQKQAASTSTKSFRASDIPADDFDDIGELFERVAAGQGA